MRHNLPILPHAAFHLLDPQPRIEIRPWLLIHGHHRLYPYHKCLEHAIYTIFSTAFQLAQV